MRSSPEPRDRHTAERGNAIIEFVFLAVMLMIPTVYALLAISHAQSGAYAAVAAAQQSLQVIEAGDRSRVSEAAAQDAARFAARDYGVDPQQVRAELSCFQGGGDAATDITWIHAW